MITDLLDELAKKFDDESISHLREIFFSQLCKVIDDKMLNSYTILEWNYAITYILQTKVDFQNKEELKLFFNSSL